MNWARFLSESRCGNWLRISPAIAETASGEIDWSSGEVAATPPAERLDDAGHAEGHRQRHRHEESEDCQNRVRQQVGPRQQGADGQEAKPRVEHVVAAEQQCVHDPTAVERDQRKQVEAVDQHCEHRPRQQPGNVVSHRQHAQCGGQEDAGQRSGQGDDDFLPPRHIVVMARHRRPK